MQSTVTMPRRLKRIAIALVIIVALPAVLLIWREWTYLKDNQGMIDEIYRQRLETILFSVNQYAWDVVNSWAGQVALINQQSDTETIRRELRDFLTRNRALSAVFLADEGGKNIEFISVADPLQFSPEQREKFRAALLAQADVLARLDRYQKSGYRKLQPVFADSGSTANTMPMALVYPLDLSGDRAVRFAGLLLSPRDFIRIDLFPKLEEVAGETFQLAVVAGDEQFSYESASPIELDKSTQLRDLWLIPGYQLAIRQRGETLEEVAASWFRINLALVLLLAVTLVGAGWFIYRTIRQEVYLAQLKSDFVSNISHELRTPLSLIRMYAETLEMGRIPGDARKMEYYRIIGQESERLTHLVNNILNFSRIEAGRKEYHLQPVDLNSLVRHVLETYRFHLENKGFTLESALDETLPVIPADTDALSEALINLIDNGIKYSEKEKWLRIATGQAAGMVFLEVADRGIGIPEKEQKRIFEKFHRASDALVHNTKGSGLGLSLVQHIVQAHHGRIELQSEPGKGSRFRLLFPIAATNHQ